MIDYVHIRQAAQKAAAFAAILLAAFGDPARQVYRQPTLLCMLDAATQARRLHE